MKILSTPSKFLEANFFDPSEYRPDGEIKSKNQFRIYDVSNPRFDTVRETYREMHENQTVAFVQAKHEQWCKFDKARMSVMEGLRMLNQLVDDSDPDVDIPNMVHAFQTAERIREVHPDKDWFHLTGLIHDLGKIMALWGEPQWAVVGDTFPVGCAFSPAIVHHDTFAANPDSQNPLYNTTLGQYKEHCGLDNITMSWGHDEYMYQVLKANDAKLPEEALACIRYHSFYPWHTGEAYEHLCGEGDEQALAWVQEFNKFDLYSKADELPDVDALLPYYQGLIDKYIPGDLRW